MKARIVLRSILFAISLLLPSISFSEIYIEDVQKLEIHNKYHEVKRTSFVQIPFNLPENSQLTVSTHMHNRVYKDMSVYVCSEQGFLQFRAGVASDCKGINKGREDFTFNYSPSQAGIHYVVLDNTYANFMKKKATVKVEVQTMLGKDGKQKLHQLLSSFYKEAKDNFITPDFNMSYKKCGQANAFSTYAGGHVTVCSELFSELKKKKIVRALAGIIYHELGHTLLNVWGVPGWNNEETADEFAMVMLYKTGVQEMAIEWIEFFAENDPRMEAQNIVSNDVKHPLSIQRIRNIKRILQDPKPVMERWNNMLYPHMTDEALLKIQKNPQKYDDSKLAAKTLENRAMTRNF
ncbi:DUF4344 domain-containing metallopeptidase [Pseudomonadota bacterium]